MGTSVAKFISGQFDAEFTEKVAHKGTILNVQLLELLRLFGAKI